ARGRPSGFRSRTPASAACRDAVRTRAPASAAPRSSPRWSASARPSGESSSVSSSMGAAASDRRGFGTRGAPVADAPGAPLLGAAGLVDEQDGDAVADRVRQTAVLTGADQLGVPLLEGGVAGRAGEDLQEAGFERHGDFPSD